MGASVVAGRPEVPWKRAVILVTVGMQLPFDRLIRAVDEIAAELDEPIAAQVGVSRYRPKNFEGAAAVPAREFEELFRQARFVVAHAGIGTVLNAQRHQKPLVVVPRQAKYGEHRNDHQLATCAQLEKRSGIFVAWETTDLRPLFRSPNIAPPSEGDQSNKRQLIEGLRDYFAGRTP
jgi:exopolysaccharide biosynthesis glucuronosyltransferase PssE